MEKQGHGDSGGLLFRPLNKARNGFEDWPLTTPAMGKRMKKHFQPAGLHDDETLHSFRRSGAQHAVVVFGYTKNQVMALGGWKSYAAMKGYISEVVGELKDLQARRTIRHSLDLRYKTN